MYVGWGIPYTLRESGLGDYHNTVGLGSPSLRLSVAPSNWSRILTRVSDQFGDEKETVLMTILDFDNTFLRR